MSEKFANVEVRRQLQTRLNDLQIAKKDPIAYGKISDKQQFATDMERTERTLENITPPDLSGSAGDSQRQRLSMLQEFLVNGDGNKCPPMPSERQCWENGSTTASKMIQWNNFMDTHTLDSNGKIIKVERGKGARSEVKDLRRCVYKDQEEEVPDIASLENIRPRDAADPLADVQRRSYGMSMAARAKYEEVFPDHPMSDVEKKVEQSELEKLQDQIKELEAKLAENANKKESKAAASERMKAYHAARKAQKAAETQQGANP